MEKYVGKYEKGKQLQKECERLALGLIAYEGIMLIFCIVTFIAQALIMAIMEGSCSDAVLDKIFLQLEKSGWGYLVSILIGIIFLSRFYKKLEIHNLFEKKRNMTRKHLIRLICLLMGSQLVFSLLSAGGEYILNQYGFTMLGAEEEATATSLSLSMFLYASVFGPIVEELIFRGFCLRVLQKYGKEFAIVVSAILFGTFHMNLPQGLYAIAVGIILGYVAMEYSIKWSIALHIINNCIFGDLLSYLTMHFSETVQNVIYAIIMLGFFIAAVVILIQYRRKIAVYFRKKEAGKCRYVFMSRSMIFYFVITIAAACMYITTC